jgi:plasmid stability protein
LKTTLELPDSLFRKAKATAARQGRSLKELVHEALAEKLAQIDGGAKKQKPWMVLAGGLKHLHAENKRIERIIEDEFEKIEPEDRG